VSIYSTLLFTGSVGTTEQPLFTVASGVDVLRDIEVWNPNSSATSVTFYLRGAPGFADSFLLRPPAIPTNESWQWQGRVVLPAGAHLGCQAETGSLFVTVSGYVLSP
jgi:hypothetical protein